VCFSQKILLSLIILCSYCSNKLNSVNKVTTSLMHNIMTTRRCLEALNERSATVFLILLLCADLAFFGMHFIAAIIGDIIGDIKWVLENKLFNIERDRVYPEMYQYIKFFWIIILLFNLSLKNRSLHYIPWVLLFTYFLFDDSISIHERGGNLFAEHFNFTPHFGLRLQDYGQLATSATAGIFLFLPLVWAYRKGTQIFRKISLDIGLLVLVLVFFGVVVDTMREAVHLGNAVDFIMGFVEESGEMLAVSLVLWYIFLLNVRGVNAGYYLCDFVRIVLTRRYT